MICERSEVTALVGISAGNADTAGATAAARLDAPATDATAADGLYGALPKRAVRVEAEPERGAISGRGSRSGQRAGRRAEPEPGRGQRTRRDRRGERGGQRRGNAAGVRHREIEPGVRRFEHADLARETVAAAGHGDDQIAVAVERAANRGDLRLHRVRVDIAARPDDFAQLGARHHAAACVEQRREHRERTRAEFDDGAVGNQQAHVAREPESRESDHLTSEPR
jgi:hypothetical protein